MGGFTAVPVNRIGNWFASHEKNSTVNRGLSLAPESHAIRSLNHAEQYAAGAAGQP